MAPRNRRKSKVEGLYKRCRHDNWDRCDCAWWGRVGRHRVCLEKWCRKPVPNKLIAKIVVGRMRAAILDGRFDRRGERPEAVTNSTSFGALLDDYLKQHVEAKKLRSTSIRAYIEVFRRKFGDEKLGVVAADPTIWENWLNECRERGGVSEENEAETERDTNTRWADATFARYVQFGRALFNWAKRRKMVSENPFDVLIEGMPAGFNKRDTRITPEQEQKLFDACDRLDEPPKSKLVRVTPELVTEIRTRVESGELQKDIAASTGLSRPLICQIVNGKVWNPNTRRRNVGSEMKRRVVAAIDLGLREGEMLLLQVKHIDYDNWQINLPAAITKAKRDEQLPVESERLKQVLIERRALGSDGYVFGKENGKFTASFDKSWKKLFRLAGLPVGRKNGYVWHDLRHEFGSHLADKGAGIHELKELMRHSDIRTTARYLKARDERKRELLATLEKRRG